MVNLVRHSLTLAVSSLALFVSAPIHAEVIDAPVRVLGDSGNIVSERKQVHKMQAWTEWKLKNTLPHAMQRENADFWIVALDPRSGFRSLSSTFALLLPANAEGMVNDFAPIIIVSLDKKSGAASVNLVGSPDGFSGLLGSMKGKNVAFSGSDWEGLVDMLGLPETAPFTTIDSEQLEASFLQEQPDEAINVYEHVSRVAYEVYKEAFSNKVVVPNVTTTDDLNWWFRARYKELGLNTSDHPTVTIQRAKSERKKYAEPDETFQIAEPPRNGYNVVLRPGDLVFADTGIQYFGLNTDTQQCGYVLKPGETEMPEGLRKAFANGRRFQDIVMAELKPDALANDVYEQAMKKGKAEKLRPELYAHPLPQYFMRYQSNGGFLMPNRYFAGPEIGREGSEGEADSLRIGLNTTYALEMDVEYSVPEWGGQDIRMMMETNIAVTRDGARFLGGRQTSCFLIH